MRVREHVALAWFTGALFGAVELARSGLGGLLAVFVGAALAGLVGALWGIVQAGLVAIARRGAATATRLIPDDGEPRGAAIRRRALGLGLGVAGLAYAGLLVVLFARLGEVEDLELVAALRPLIAVFGAAAALAVGVALAGASLPALAALDDRRPFPWLRPQGLRQLVLAGLGCALALVILGRGDDLLGILAWGPYLLLFVGVEVGVAVALDRVRRLERAVRRGLVATGVVLSVGALVFAEGSAPVYAGVDASRGPWLGRELLRRLTDVDGDGFAPIVGGGDCAPFDAAIAPQALDVPGNGVDENCDGVDAALDEGDGDPLADHYYGVDLRDRVRRYDVVWIVVDALRADHVGAYGYAAPTTPYIDQFAAEALTFTRAYSQSSATMLSIPSMLSGRDPLAATWEYRDDKLALSPIHPTFAELVTGLGYRTSMIVTSYIYVRLQGILRGYAEVVDAAERLPKTRGGRRASASTADHALDFLHRHFADSGAGEPPPYLLTVYFEDPHMPYSARAPGYPSFDGPLADYDQEIAATDRHIGMILEALRLSPRWDRTIVIITADHGEEFKEHGGRAHSRTCYVESVHVPLLVRIPGVRGRRVERAVGLVDLVPTLLELLGAEAGVEVDGQSLLIPTFAPERAPAERPVFCAVLSQKPSQGHFLRYAVRTAEHLLVEEAIEGRVELYELADDPQEVRPVAREGAAKETLTRLWRRLKAAQTGNLGGRLLTR
ncbi:MAG: sulfatase [Nannocystaceae bacterium]